MRVILKSFYFVLTLLLLLVLQTRMANAEDRWIRVTSPNGGETWNAGETHTITWESSSNIDKVSIGYTQGPGHLDWVIFETSNTKSYSWKVFVGNTTSTQYKIDITGFQTGYGSVTDQSDGQFTVPQAPPVPTPTTNPSNPIPTSPQVVTTIAPTGVLSYYQNTYTPNRSITPAINRIITQPTLLTIYTLTFGEIFYFEGSKTTDISKILDPKNVTNFTLDMKLYTFSFTEPLDLTNQTNLQAISRVEGFLYIETGEIWIEQDWWDKYKINKPITVTYKNPNLTTFAPTVKKEQEKENHPTVSSTKNPEVLEAKSGEAKFKLTDGTKVKILPNVKIETENNIVTNKNSRTFKARSSHKNLSYFAKINGKKQTLSAKNFNQKTGEFTIEVEGFEKGNNYIEFYFTQDKENPVLIKGINLKYDPNFIANLNAWQQLALLAVVLMSFVMLRKILLSKLPANPK